MQAFQATIFGLLLIGIVSCGPGHADTGSVRGRFGDMPGIRTIEIDPQATVLPPPPFETEDIWMCSDCHDPELMDSDPEERELADPHDVLTFNHGAGKLWCMDCHDGEDRDMLHLSSGKLLEFEQAPQLCGQCHSTNYKDWRAGAHGKRTGQWNGAKEVRPCSHCHNAHTPNFGALEPKPAPQPPEVTR
jgi:nitrate/TMAO reductase-like tetraheme cytochrome c subunit